jgi:hypothetical protein
VSTEFPVVLCPLPEFEGLCAEFFSGPTEQYLARTGPGCENGVRVTEANVVEPCIHSLPDDILDDGALVK